VDVNLRAIESTEDLIGSNEGRVGKGYLLVAKERDGEVTAEGTVFASDPKVSAAFDEEVLDV